MTLVRRMNRQRAIRPRLLIVQTGDFGFAWSAMAEGKPETYRDQHASLRFVADLARDFDVTTLALCSRHHDERLDQGLRSMGVLRVDLNPRRAAALMDQLRPDRLIIRTPSRPFLAEAQRRSIATLPNFADIFAPTGLRDRLHHWKLSRILRGPHVVGVSNHSLNASRSMVTALRLPPERVIPWDWTPMLPEPRTKPTASDPRRPRCIYVGPLSEAKGLGDCLQALALLHQQGIAAQLTVAGNGNIPAWIARATALGLSDAVDLKGLISNAQVRAEMADHDIVIVPSRPEYDEGLPNTIYEGLASRSPLIVSNHPAFAGRLRDGIDALVFKAGDPARLAAAIGKLCADPALYAALSTAAGDALHDLHVGLEWSDLVRLFLDDPQNRRGWVERHSLAGLNLI